MTEELKARIAQINAGTAPAGYKKTKVGIVPEEWDNELFSNIFSEQVRHTNDFTVYPLYSLTIEDGVVPKSERYERSHLVKKEDVFKVVSPDDFVYNPMNVRFGAVARYKGSFPVSVSGYYDVFSVNDGYSKEYMESFLLSSPMILYYNKVATGSLIEKQRVHFSQFLRFNLPVPPLPEQQKIAEILTAQDAVIALMQKQIELLQKQKKAFLQKMFPQKGCTVPEIRFAGFTDAWEQRKVLDLLIQPITDGPHETPELVENGIPFISVDAIVDNKIDFSRKRGDITEEYNIECCKKYRPQLYDVYLVKSGATVGKVAIVETTDIFNIWSPLAAMRCGDKTNPYYLYYLLQTKDMQAQVVDKASNGTQPNLGMRALEKFGVTVTTNGEEQRLIGEYFRNLDNIITLHQRKLEIEQRKKKALMQLLLTGKVRVKT